MAVSGAAGLVFALWSLTYWLPEMRDDTDLAELVVSRWPAERFAIYTLAVSAAFAFGHYAIGFCWPRTFAPRRLGLIVVTLGFAVFAIPTVIAVPWGPLKFVLILAVILRFLRRQVRAPHEASILTDLAGRVPVAHLSWLLPLPAVAIGVYTLADVISPPMSSIRVISTTVVAATTIAAVVVLAVTARRLRRDLQPRDAAAGRPVRRLHRSARKLAIAPREAMSAKGGDDTFQR